MTDWLSYETELGGTIAISCDIITDASFTQNWDVTEFPVEDGTPISDSIQRKNAEMTVTILQSATPIQVLVRKNERKLKRPVNTFEATGLLALTSAVSGAIGSLFGIGDSGDDVKVTTFDDPDTARYEQQLEDDLLTCGNLGALCSISVGEKTRSNLVVTSITVKKRKGASEFVVSFRERRTVKGGAGVGAVGLPRPRILKPPTIKIKKSTEKPPEKIKSKFAQLSDWASQ